MLNILQVIFAILLITAILLQNKGTGLGAAFGGGGNLYRTKRGAEKVLHIATIVIVVIFIGLLIANIFIA
jgi:protein translocase SecG subunit